MLNKLFILKLTNQNTGEIEDYTVTRFGLQKLSKNILNYVPKSKLQIYKNDVKYFNNNYTEEQNELLTAKLYFKVFMSQLSSMFRRNNMFDTYLFLDSLMNKYRICGSNYNWYPSLELDEISANIVKTNNNAFKFIEDTFWFNGQIYERKLRKYVRKCQCGTLYIDQELLERDCNEDYVSCIRNRDIGYGMCHDCTEYGGELRQCADCGLWGEDMLWCENESYYVCQDCADNGAYAYCEHCGCLISTQGDYEYSDRDGIYFCDIGCAHRHGYYYNDRYDTLVSEDDYECWEDEHKYVGDYHSHDYEPYGERNARMVHDLMIGMELEIDGKDYHSCDNEFFEGLYKSISDQNVFFEDDGSLQGGFEIITQPHFEKEFFNLNWKEFTKKIADEGFRSHDTETCGLHFHYSKWYLGRNEDEINNNAKKVCAFFERNWDDLVKFSRRSADKLSHWASKYNRDINKETKVYSLVGEGRYRAVNLSNLHKLNKSTIEIRICRGTLNENTIFASADLFLHIVRNAKRISWKNIDNLNLWFKGIKENTKEYMAKRDCFGSFLNA